MLEASGRDANLAPGGCVVRDNNPASYSNAVNVFRWLGIHEGIAEGNKESIVEGAGMRTLPNGPLEGPISAKAALRIE